MVRVDRGRLEGPVEVDETHYGGVEEGVTGRETLKRSVVVIAVERRPAKRGMTVAGRVRMVARRRLR